ncbi:MAG: toprim domain-containing protein [Calditrichaeota bacterium]|nr:toprim domain-containing protein [Calditrichota bacterium]MCB0266698.1 toprim domain-containing protein [Calditrichota bacterium]MCB9067270.1 toprim domain-containing protein [Calditrichia bacterium]
MNASVTQFLLEKHGIQVSAGKQTGCPYCGHNSLSINRDDNLAKCFFPSCGKFIKPFSSNNDFYSKVYHVLEKLYQDFHNELLKQQNQTDQTAYSYLSRERNLHPQIIKDAMLGVVPQEYNSSSIFSDIEDELSEKLQNKKQSRTGKRGRPLKQTGLSEEDQIGLIQTIKEKLLNCLEGTAGWLCFFYTDENHRITAIRFRKPYSKEILFFKPFQKVGVFGLNLFAPFKSPEWTFYNQSFIVVEGEFNLLSLQSLTIKYCKSQGWHPGYIHAAAVGSVTCADCQTLRKVCKTPIICYDND